MKVFSSRSHSSFWNAPNLFAGTCTLVVLILLAFHLFDQYRFIRSDDALVQAHFTPIETKVQGIVKSVLVDEHQSVKKGQVLALIDRREFNSTLGQRRETARAIDAELRNAKINWIRARNLFAKGHLSTQERDQSYTDYLKQKSQIEAQHAKSELALINLDYAEVRAPEDGVISVRSVSPGASVKSGDPLFGLVFSNERWVEARIKETDLHDVHLGKSVRVEIDAIPDRKFDGKIQSISPSTEGLEAALIPDNAAGNFTKYVQRVPVRISLDLSPDERQIVRAGLSANIRIRRD